MTVAQSKEQSRREAILNAATSVFSRDGLEKASMRMIAREASCTTGAIYPLFDGKEAIYAALLERSLKALHATVATASAAEPDALKSLEAAARAWHDYYIAHTFEAELGLYMHSGRGVYGLGADRDAMLNDLLMQTLDIFKACFIRLAPESAGRKTEAWARAERDRLFAELIGILVLANSRRTESIGTTAEALLGSSLQALRERLN